MEMNKESLMALAERIYDLDTEVYRCVGSSLGRVFAGEKEACVEELAPKRRKRNYGYPFSLYLPLSSAL